MSLKGDSDLIAAAQVSPGLEAAMESPSMRSFLISNTGSLPLKLSVFDQDDILRVDEVVMPFAQYPFERNS
jgi:hypothetical protein